MNPNAQRRPPRIAFSGFLVLLLPLLAAALACSIVPSGDQSLRATDIALGIQQTLVAQTSTALAVGGAPTATAPAAPTSIPVSQPLPATDTATVPPPVDTPTSPAAATDTPAASTSLEPVKITDWKMFSWMPLNSGCKVPDALCWKMDDNYKKHANAADLTLTSKTPVRIDPAWPSPYLVFWHKYQFASVAYINIKGDSTWSTVQILNKQRSSDIWVRGAINLNAFKGKEVLISFGAAGIWGSGGIPGSDWFVNDVQIIPDYSP